MLDILMRISFFSPLPFRAILCSVDEKFAFCCHWHPRAVHGKLSALQRGENALSNAIEGAFMMPEVMLHVSTQFKRSRSTTSTAPSPYGPCSF